MLALPKHPALCIIVLGGKVESEGIGGQYHLGVNVQLIVVGEHDLAQTSLDTLLFQLLLDDLVVVQIALERVLPHDVVEAALTQYEALL
jgi:hypothetical protein